MPDVTAPVFHRYVALGDSFTEGVGDPDPARPERPARLGRPGRRGAGRAVPTTSATPTSRSAAARCAAIIAEQLEPALALQPDLVTIYAGGNDLIRPRCRRRRARRGVRRGDRPARRHRRHGRAVHRLRPGRRRAVRTAARPVRGLQRAGPRDRRPARRRRPGLLADAARAPRADVVRGPPMHLGPLGHQRDRHRGARHPRVSPTTSSCPTRPARSARRRSRPDAGRTSSGRCATPPPGSNAASPGGPPATGSPPNGPTLEPI